MAISRAGDNTRGFNKLVAVRIKFGWVLSGPIKGKKFDFCDDSSSFVVCAEANSFSLAEEKPKPQLDKQIAKLWDLDSMGIRPSDDVYTDVVDNVTFTGERYSVALLWKVGHRQLPSNYANCVSRLKKSHWEAAKRAKTACRMRQHHMTTRRSRNYRESE